MRIVKTFAIPLLLGSLLLGGCELRAQSTPKQPAKPVLPTVNPEEWRTPDFPKVRKAYYTSDPDKAWADVWVATKRGATVVPAYNQRARRLDGSPELLWISVYTKDRLSVRTFPPRLKGPGGRLYRIGTVHLQDEKGVEFAARAFL